MSSSQMSAAIANGLNPKKAVLLPIGVDLDMHNIIDQSKLSVIQIHIKRFETQAYLAEMRLVFALDTGISLSIPVVSVMK